MMTTESRHDPPQDSNAGRYSLWLVARMAWVAVALFAIGISVISIFGYWSELQKVCLDGASACSDKGLLTQGNMHELGRLGISLGVYSAYVIALRVFSLTVWVVVGAVIFWRTSEDLMALLVAFMLVAFGTIFQVFSFATSLGFSSTFLDVLPGAYSPLLIRLIYLLAVLGVTTFILFLYLFPDGRFVPWWALFPALAWIANDMEGIVFPNLFTQYRWVNVMGFLLFFVPALCAVGSQIYRYRRISGPEQRQQTKWVIFGISVGPGGFLAVVVLEGFFPGLEKTGLLGGLFSQTLTTVLWLMIPLSVGVAILRSRLFDIDVVINRALVYGSLTVSLVLVYLGSVVTLQYLFRVLTSENSQLTIVASTLAIAALFNPLRHRLQTFVDRRFYRKKYDAAKTLAAFSAKLRDETNLDDLNAEMISVVNETMQPEHFTLWLKPMGTWKSVQDRHHE